VVKLILTGQSINVRYGVYILIRIPYESFNTTRNSIPSKSSRPFLWHNTFLSFKVKDKSLAYWLRPEFDFFESAPILPFICEPEKLSPPASRKSHRQEIPRWPRRRHRPPLTTPNKPGPTKMCCLPVVLTRMGGRYPPPFCFFLPRRYLVLKITVFLRIPPSRSSVLRTVRRKESRRR
jgi:hypothetical protein